MPEKIFTLIQITYTIVLPIVLTYIAQQVKQHNNANDNGKKADMLLLRQALINIHDDAMLKGEITQYSFQCFNDIWELYHDGYKGNTLTDRFHDEIMNLPIKR